MEASLAPAGGASGLLFDFLSRLRTEHRTVGLRDSDPLAALLSQGLPSGSDKAIPIGYEITVAQIVEETLQRRLVDIVLPYWKAGGDPAWKPPADLLRRRAEEVFKHRRMLACYRTELSLRLGQLSRQEQTAGGSPQKGLSERRDASLFWEKFHRGFRKGTPPAPGQEKEDSALSGALLRSDVLKGSESWKCRSARRAPVAGKRNIAFGKSGEFGRSINRSIGRLPQIGDGDSLAGSSLFGSSTMPLSPMSVDTGVRFGKHDGDPIWGSIQPDSLQQQALLMGGGPLPKSSSMPNLRPGGQPAGRSTSEAMGGFRRNSAELVLPPIERPHICPHSETESVVASAKQSGSLANKYLKQCDEAGLVPIDSQLIPFIMGNSSQINAATKAIKDHDLMALLAAAPKLSVKEVDLTDNPLLSDRALSRFVGQLCLDPAVAMLQKLCLKGCTGAGVGTLPALLTLVAEASALRLVDLSSVPLNMKTHLPLCKVLGAHPSLEVLRLAEVGLSGGNAKLCVGELAASTTLHTLDLSWNSLGAEAFTALGEGIEEKKMIRSLTLVNCSAVSSASQTGDLFISPCMFLMEPLAGYAKLTHLDVSMNRIDFQGALVLEDALLSATKLEELNVSGNPLGSEGLRCLVRLLLKEGKGRSQPRLLCSNCACSQPPRSSVQLFDASGAGGKYLLDMEVPYDRAFLRALYRRCEQLGRKPEDLLADSLIEGGPGAKAGAKPAAFSHPSAKEKGVWPLPERKGVIATRFDLEAAVTGAAKKADGGDLAGALRQCGEAARPQPSFRKAVALLAQWHSMEQPEQFALLTALSQDFRVGYAFVALLLQQSRPKAREILSKLLPCLAAGGQTLEQFLALQHLATLDECVRFLARGRPLLLFNAQSPSGHYKLDLWAESNPADRHVAESLLLLDRWEASVARGLERRDVSERGDFAHVRDLRHLGVPVTCSVTEWSLPGRGALELGYCSGRRPAEGAEPLSDEAVGRMLACLKETAIPAPRQVETIRSVAHLLVLTASQLRQIMGSFKEPVMRADVFAALIIKVVDMVNFSCIRELLAEGEQLAALRRRVGQVTLFPFYERAFSVELDLARHDQRMAAHIVAQLAAKEKREFLTDASLTTKLLDEKGQVAGEDVAQLSPVPKLWETTFEKMPKVGVFRAKYACPEEEPCNVKARGELLETFGFWHPWEAPPSEEEAAPAEN